MSPTTQTPEPSPILIGISACLLGEEVRFDGGHKRDRYITDTLGQFVEFVPVCPEVDMGLGTPRESLRLVGAKDSLRIVASKSGNDVTRAMQRYARRKLTAIEDLDLCGFILKRGSPSCGMERVRVYGSSGAPSRDGRGMFADLLMRRNPLLPVEEEGRLQDPRLRENFIERVFAYRRLRNVFGRRWRARDVVHFHTTEKLLLLAHRPQTYRELGKLVAGLSDLPRAELARQYQDAFMNGLRTKATPGKHVNVIQHMAGYFKKQIAADEKDELATVIADYKAGLVPLIAPLTLMRHYVRRFSLDYLGQQTYLAPHPKELMLRNHV